jgi:hypothetical protein
VDTYDTDGLYVDTAAVSDGDHPYETAVAHPDYNDGEMIIVEAYDTKKEAQVGHVKWVERMTTNLPEELVDCANSHISQMIDALAPDKMRFPRKTKRE